MKLSDFASLEIGDIVRPSGGASSYVVTGNYGGRVTAVRTADLTNPGEWDLIVKNRDQVTAPTPSPPPA